MQIELSKEELHIIIEWGKTTREACEEMGQELEDEDTVLLYKLQDLQDKLKLCL